MSNVAYGFSFIPLILVLIYLGLIALVVYVLILIIKALNIYIRKNS